MQLEKIKKIYNKVYVNNSCDKILSQEFLTELIVVSLISGILMFCDQD